MAEDNLAAANRILAEFGISQPKSVTRLMEGHSGEVYCISAEHTPVAYVLHIRSGDRRALAMNQAAIAKRLTAAGLAAPVFRFSRKTMPYYFDDTITATLYPWIEGVHPKDTDLAGANLETLGRCLALFHVAVKGLSSITDSKLLDDDWQWWLARQSAIFLKNPDVLRLCETIKTLSRNRLPQGIVHGDYHRNNLLMNDSRIAILDLERSSSGVLLFDIARAAIDLCSEGEVFSTEKSESFLRGYESMRELELLERRCYRQSLVYAALAVAAWFEKAGIDSLRDQFLRRGLSTLDVVENFSK